MTNTVNEPTGSGYWGLISENLNGQPNCDDQINLPLSYRIVNPDLNSIQLQLYKSKTLDDSTQIKIPMMDGAIYPATLKRSQSIPLEWQDKFGIAAFSGHINNMYGTMIRLEIDSSSIRFMTVSEKGTEILMRVCKESDSKYILFNKKDLPPGSKTVFE
ncbi:MAG: hypothetical protein ACK5C5_01685 [Bacteroidota bacterium]|jgi:hypothetical protein